MKIKQMFLEVCGSCQNKCFYCAHGGMITAYRDYQLSIEELRKFIECTRDSGYSIETMRIHGIGEPLLWKYFDEGIALLKKSGVTKKLIVHSNGILLDRIADETWRYIDGLVVSAYPDYPKYNVLIENIERAKVKFKDKIEVVPMSEFIPLPLKRYKNTIPCHCYNYGPMFVKDKVFLHCGPAVFDAAALKGIDIFEWDHQHVSIKDHYMETYDSNKIGNMELCEYCWANSRIIRPSYPHNYRPSRARIIVDSWFIDKRISVAKCYVNMRDKLSILKLQCKKFLEYKNNNGLRAAIKTSISKLFPIFFHNKNVWGLKYALDQFFINYVPANPFYKKYVNSKIALAPRIQLGAGETICRDWLHQDVKIFQGRKHKNLDFTINVLRLKKYIKSNSLDAILTSHMLEHLSRDEVKDLLSECHRWLRPGGAIWISVPDLSILFDVAKDEGTSEDDRHSAMMLISSPRPGHVSCWFFEDLKRILEMIGFDKIQKWTEPPREFQNVKGCWSVTIAGKLISLNILAFKKC